VNPHTNTPPSSPHAHVRSGAGNTDERTDWRRYARAALALMRNTWLAWSQQRSFFFLIAFGWLIPPLIYLFVWSSAAGEDGIGGMSRDQFIVYYLVLIAVNQLTYSQTNWTVGDAIRSGGFNRLLLYPLPPIFDTLAAELAGKLLMLSFAVPVALGVGLFLRPQVDITGVQLALFLPAVLLAWLLRFLWGYSLALLAFWTTRADALLTVQDALVFLLAGQVAPVALLPGMIQAAAIALPFRYMVGFPVEILTGQLGFGDIALGFVLGSGWLLLALAATLLLWRRGLRRYSAVGG
jgi:ABC-2 type transport system permease protein